MNGTNIDIVGLYKFSAAKYRQYGSFILGIAVTYYICAIVPQIYFLLRVPGEPTARTRIISFVLSLVQLFLTLGFIKIMLLLIDDLETGIRDLFSHVSHFLSYFVASFLYGFAILAGLFLLIVPGIYLAIRLQFYPYFILDRGDSSFEALINSFRATDDWTLELFLFGITVLFLNFMGILLFGIGMVITYPLTTMATAVVYRNLHDDTTHIPTERYRIPNRSL